jgi:hypothetical protein
VADRPTEGFEQILRGQIEETGRPLNPTFKDVLSGWVDPTARAFFKPDGETITRRERTLVSVSSYYVAEGFMGALTPLAMLQWAIAMLTFLGLTDDELTHGFQGIEVDPWGELAELPAEAREEFGRALWHLGEGLAKAGLDG